MKVYMVIVERDDGSLGVVRQPSEEDAVFINRVLWSGRALATAASEYSRRLVPPDEHTTRISLTGAAFADAVEAFGAEADATENPDADGRAVPS